MWGTVIILHNAFSKEEIAEEGGDEGVRAAEAGEQFA